MSHTDNANTGIREAAEALASAHRKNDPELQAIYWAPHDSEIRLVEVSESVGTTYEIMPFRFSPQDDIKYPSVIILLSKEEFEAVKRGDLPLPESWGCDATQELKELYNADR